MEYMVKEVWKNGHVAEFGPFASKEVAEDFSVNCQMPNAAEVLDRVEVVQFEE